MKRTRGLSAGGPRGERAGRDAEQPREPLDDTRGMSSRAAPLSSLRTPQESSPDNEPSEAHLLPSTLFGQQRSAPFWLTKEREKNLFRDTVESFQDVVGRVSSLAASFADATRASPGRVTTLRRISAHHVSRSQHAGSRLGQRAVNEGRSETELFSSWKKKKATNKTPPFV